MNDCKDRYEKGREFLLKIWNPKRVVKNTEHELVFQCRNGDFIGYIRGIAPILEWRELYEGEGVSWEGRFIYGKSMNITDLNSIYTNPNTHSRVKECVQELITAFEVAKAIGLLN